MNLKPIFATVALCLGMGSIGAQNLTSITPGELWPDDRGEHINAHGGNIIYHEGIYYWYGENRPARGFTTEEGVNVYSSRDLMNWKNEGVALAVSETKDDDIERGCIMERPKVVYNKETKRFVMLFHLELKGRGYEAARVGFAVSESPIGPFKFIRSLRPNAGKWPMDFTKRDIKRAEALDEAKYREWWTPEWRRAVSHGLLLKRDLPGGQMSRDMTVFVDDDGTAYHIHSAEENLTLNIAELTPDYLDYTGRYIRLAPGGHNEAPTLMKRDGVYWMITSGCTGWEPNEARMFRAKSMWGPWEQLPTPFRGEDAHKSFHSQGTYIFKVEGTDEYIFMADRWMPRSLRYSRHIWLPITFDPDGIPLLRWRDEWNF